MSASRTIPSRSPTITPHIETVCANNTRICPTNSDKRASSPLYPGSMASNSISVSVNLNAAPDTAESNYLPLQNLCRWGAGAECASSYLCESSRCYRSKARLNDWQNTNFWVSQLPWQFLGQGSGAAYRFRGGVTISQSSRTTPG